MRSLALLQRGTFVLQSGNATFVCALPFDGKNIAEHIREQSLGVVGMYCSLEYSYAH